MVSSEKIEFGISSRRNAASNALQNTPNLITVHVEATEDKSFWSYILRPYFKSLDFRAYSNKKLQTGKKGILDFETGESLIVCLDSDYDYLLQNPKLQKTGIFQTYAYATENLKCYPESLHTICTDVTHNPTAKINFLTFLEQFSQIIYELFIWHLYFFSISEESKFSMDEFNALIKIPTKFNLRELDKCVLNPLKNRIEIKLAELKKDYPHLIAEISDFSIQLKELDLNCKNTYLFVRGHNLYDDIVLSLLRSVCDNLKIDSIKEINESKADLEHKNKTREDYINSIGNIEERIKLTLFLNKDFKKCPLFQKITTDIENYLATFKQHSQGLNHV